MTADQSVTKLKLTKPPPTGIEHYQYLQKVWEHEQMSIFRVFLCWCCNKNAVPTLEAMQKTIAFCHGRDFDLLKLGCTLPNLVDFRLHKSTDIKFYPFKGRKRNLLEKISEDVVGGPSIVFTFKQLLMKLLFGNQRMFASL